MCAPWTAQTALDLKNERHSGELPMKKFLLATVALVALGATVPALAADLPARTQYTKAPAYAAPLYNWTGFYMRGRIGYTWGPGLLYVKGGYAFSDNNDSLVNGAGASVPFALSGNHSNGYTVGAGLEYMFTQNWSGKIEYQCD